MDNNGCLCVPHAASVISWVAFGSESNEKSTNGSILQQIRLHAAIKFKIRCIFHTVSKSTEEDLIFQQKSKYLNFDSKENKFQILFCRENWNKFFWSIFKRFDDI